MSFSYGHMSSNYIKRLKEDVRKNKDIIRRNVIQHALKKNILSFLCWKIGIQREPFYKISFYYVEGSNININNNIILFLKYTWSEIPYLNINCFLLFSFFRLSSLLFMFMFMLFFFFMLRIS